MKEQWFTRCMCAAKNPYLPPNPHHSWLPPGSFIVQACKKRNGDLQILQKVFPFERSTELVQDKSFVLE